MSDRHPVNRASQPMQHARARCPHTFHAGRCVCITAARRRRRRQRPFDKRVLRHPGKHSPATQPLPLRMRKQKSICTYLTYLGSTYVTRQQQSGKSRNGVRRAVRIPLGVPKRRGASSCSVPSEIWNRSSASGPVPISSDTCVNLLRIGRCTGMQLERLCVSGV